MPETIIKVENISKLYHIGKNHNTNLRDAIVNLFDSIKGKTNSSEIRDFWALKDVNFEVNEGDVLGIIGKNGAGKSTLLKILSKITPPTSGKISIDGRIASLLEVGTGFHPELTGRENIFLNGSILGMKKIEIKKKFDEIVEFSGVEKFLDTPVKRYSSGMYVRLAFAVAAHLEPEILIIDEVLTVGDTEFQKRCIGKMQDVAKSGRTVIFVSHQLEAVSNLCNTCIMLENGSVVKQGETEQVISFYLSNKKTFSTTLKERTDRKGNGRFKFVATWIEAEDGNIIETIRSGDTIKIVMSYETDGALENDLEISVGINSVKNIAICDLSTTHVNVSFKKNKVPKTGILECIIPRIPLNSGNYSYTLYSYSRFGVEDWIQDAGNFDVEKGDFFGTGKIADSARLILIDHKWNFDR